MTTPRSVRLTALSSCAGCAAKIRPDLLGQLLAGIPVASSPNTLVGFETSDDAAVYRLSRTQAVVQTVDFFPPVLDDPFAYGQVAAANAMSDIWAMGAKALFALNLVAFPRELPVAVLREILAGGADKAGEAGVPILGGHSVYSPEPKYGMAVTGVVHPRKVLTNARARPGDVLILTKPLGTGIATTALKRGLASPGLVKLVTRQMVELNKGAAEALLGARAEVHALTDVTGFGLLGHALEMARGAQLRLQLEAGAVPVLPGVRELAEAGVVPGGTKTNLAYATRWVRFPRAMPLAHRQVLADAQTNGGLLAAVKERDAPRVLEALARRKLVGWVIGRMVRDRVGIDVRS